MKVKHILSTCGIVLGGLAVAQAAHATVTYVNSSDVQFTFSSTLSMTVSDDFEITDLAPGTSRKSNEVDVTVDTNHVSGYTLSAKVGNATYTTTDLKMDEDNVFSMIGPSATALSAGTWGYTLNDGTTYGALDTTTATVLKQTTGAPTSGSDVTSIKIGAQATAEQMSGTYQNVVNFLAVANIVTRNVTVAAGTNVASVTPVAATSYEVGDTVPITATCADGYTFTNWAKSADYGSFANDSLASTTYTVGNGDVVLTAYCLDAE